MAKVSSSLARTYSNEVAYGNSSHPIAPPLTPGQPVAPQRRATRVRPQRLAWWQQCLTPVMAVAVLIALVQSGLTMVSHVGELAQLSLTLPALAQTTTQLRQRSQWLQHELAVLATPQSLEKRAREQLGYAEANEIVLHIQGA